MRSRDTVCEMENLCAGAMCSVDIMVEFAWYGCVTRRHTSLLRLQGRSKVRGLTGDRHDHKVML